MSHAAVIEGPLKPLERCMRIWSRMVSASRTSPLSGSAVLTRRLSRSVGCPCGQVCIRARTSASAVATSSWLCRR